MKQVYYRQKNRSKSGIALSLSRILLHKSRFCLNASIAFNRSLISLTSHNGAESHRAKRRLPK